MILTGHGPGASATRIAGVVAVPPLAIVDPICLVTTMLSGSALGGSPFQSDLPAERLNRIHVISQWVLWL